jgi:hypothetical protein
MSIINHTPYGAMLEKIMALSPFQVDWSHITVRMDTRLRTTGGMAKWSPLMPYRSEVTLNATLFPTLTEAEQYEILSHEMAHSYRWQNLHRLLGGTAARCHKHEVEKNLRRRVVIYDDIKHVGILATLQKWNRLKVGILSGRTQYSYLGTIVCDLNTHTYRWETLRKPELRELPLIKNLKLAA